MIAGDNSAAVKLAEIFNAADLLDDHLLFLHQLVDEFVGDGKGVLGLQALPKGFLEVVDLVGHQHARGGILLHVLTEPSRPLVGFDLFKNGDSVGTSRFLIEYLQVIVLAVDLPQRQL